MGLGGVIAKAVPPPAVGGVKKGCMFRSRKEIAMGAFGTQKGGVEDRLGGVLSKET